MPKAAQPPWMAPELLLSLTVLFWSGNFVAGRAIGGDIAPVSLNFWRWGLALVILGAIAGPETWRHRREVLRAWPVIAALAVTGIVMFHICAYTALIRTQVINAALLLPTTPLVIVAATRLVYREPIAVVPLVGILASLVGATLVVARGDLEVLLALRLDPGDVWMLGAVVAWAAYSVLLKRRPATLPPLVLLTAIVATGMLVQAPVYLWQLATAPAFEVVGPAGLALGYIALFPSVIAYIFWNRGVAEIGPARAGSFLHLMPIFSAALSIVLLGEQVVGYHIVGGLLVAVGIVLANRA